MAVVEAVQPERRQYRIWRALVNCEGKITGHGHVVGAKQGETCPIPPELEQKASEYMELVEDQEMKEPEKVSTDRLLGDAWDERILEAMRTVVARNDPNDFIGGGGGFPKAPVLTKMLGRRVRTEDVRRLYFQVQKEVVEGTLQTK